MRKDAERNRDRLIAAAREIMRGEGGDAPMEVIAERAGVTRGTLYRNFPHRQAMYEAVLQLDLDALTARAEADREAEPLAFLRHTAELMTVYDRFLTRLADMADYDGATNQARMAEVLDAPVAHAKARGLLRAELTPGDVLIACRMLASHWKLDDARDFDAAFARRLALLDLGPRGAPAVAEGGDRG